MLVNAFFHKEKKRERAMLCIAFIHSAPRAAPAAAAAANASLNANEFHMS